MYSLRPGEIGEEKCTLWPLGISLVEENVLSVPWGDWRRKCTLCTLGRLAKKMYSLRPGEIGEKNVLSVPGEIGEENVLSAPWGDWRRKCTLCPQGRLAKKMYSLSPGEIGEENVLSAPPTPTPSATPALSLDQLDLTVFDMDSTVFDMDLTVFDIQYSATLLSA